MVPASAWAKRPMRLAEAPVNEPLAWPNSSDSTRVSGMAAQLTATNGRRARGRSGHQRLGHQLLAGARLAGDQHRALGVGDLADGAEHRSHGRVVAQQPGRGAIAPAERVGRGHGWAGVVVAVHRPQQRLFQPLELERLDQEVAGAGADGPHRIRDLGAAAHHDHRGAGILAARGLQDVEAVGARHPQVGQDDVEVLLGEPVDAAGPVRGDDVERGRAQQARQSAAQGLFVITQQKLGHLQQLLKCDPVPASQRRPVSVAREWDVHPVWLTRNVRFGTGRF